MTSVATGQCRTPKVCVSYLCSMLHFPLYNRRVHEHNPPHLLPSRSAARAVQVPDASFTVADVARVVGDDVLIRPIHVGEQANIDQVHEDVPVSALPEVLDPSNSTVYRAQQS